MLSSDEARAFYDRFGARQDSQAFYEDPATRDLIVHAEAPKLGPHKARIRSSVAELLSLPESAVGIKATTNEGLGEIGRGEAIACWAAVILHGVEQVD